MNETYSLLDIVSPVVYLLADPSFDDSDLRVILLDIVDLVLARSNQFILLPLAISYEVPAVYEQIQAIEQGSERTRTLTAGSVFGLSPSAE